MATGGGGNAPGGARTSGVAPGDYGPEAGVPNG
jgi:hypothetical protein